MIPKTKFLEVLEDIHRNTDMRYGQIIYNAISNHVPEGCKVLDDSKMDIKPPHYDFFYTYDENFTYCLIDYRDVLKRANPDYKWK